MIFKKIAPFVYVTHTSIKALNISLASESPFGLPSIPYLLPRGNHCSDLLLLLPLVIFHKNGITEHAFVCIFI